MAQFLDSTTRRNVRNLILYIGSSFVIAIIAVMVASLVDPMFGIHWSAAPILSLGGLIQYFWISKFLPFTRRQ